jgi:protein-disulfide isomerase
MSRLRALTLGAIASAIVGLGASLTSLVDDLGGAPTFCAETGCEIVRTSAWARPLGIPMSLLGVAFFSAALALAFVPAPRLRRWLAIAGGAWAVWLIALQALVIGAWCKLCLVADPAAIVHAALVAAGARTLAAAPRRLLPIAPAVLAIVALLGAWTEAPPAVAPSAPPGRPASVARAQAPDAVTIVEFVDFECPYCRAMQARLDRAIAQTPTPVRIVRKMVPLPQHAGAGPAALAYCCAEAQGRGEEMARALFAASPGELTPEGCEAIAARIGCDLDRYRADLAMAERRVASDLRDAEQAGVRALPTIFIGGERINGASASVEQLAALIARGVLEHPQMLTTPGEEQRRAGLAR